MKTKLSSIELLKFLLPEDVINELALRTLLPIQVQSGAGIEIKMYDDDDACGGGCMGNCKGGCLGCHGTCEANNYSSSN